MVLNQRTGVYKYKRLASPNIDSLVNHHPWKTNKGVCKQATRAANTSEWGGGGLQTGLSPTRFRERNLNFMQFVLIPERERGFVVLPDCSFPPAVTDWHWAWPRTREQKAKDWSRLEKICKRDQLSAVSLYPPMSLYPPFNLRPCPGPGSPPQAKIFRFRVPQIWISKAKTIKMWVHFPPVGRYPLEFIPPFNLGQNPAKGGV